MLKLAREYLGDLWLIACLCMNVAIFATIAARGEAVIYEHNRLILWIEIAFNAPLMVVAVWNLIDDLKNRSK